MARRKQKHLIPPQTAFGLLVVIGALWLVAKILQNAPSGSGNAIGLVVLVVVAGAIALPLVRLIRRASARQALLQKVRAITDQQLEPLLRRRAQLVRLDPYGKPQHDKWTKEIDYFISQHIQVSLTAGEQASLARNYAEVSEIIGNRVEAAQRQAKLEADQLANLRSLTERMDAFTRKADADLAKFAPVEQRYQYVTHRMRGALAREQSIYGGGQASVARGQISVAINQAAIQANQIHISVQSAYREFDYAASQLMREFAGASQGCRGAHPVTDTTPAPVGRDAWNAACLRFFDSARPFQQRVSDLRVAFAQVEAVWDSERREQDQIVQASNVAVQ